MKLVYAGPEEPIVVGETVHLPAKSVTALVEYARSWPGHVAAATRPAAHRDVLPPGWSAVPSEIEVASGAATTPEGLSRLAPDVVLTLHSRDAASYGDLGRPVVLTTENTARDRVDQQLISTRSWVSRARILAGMPRLARDLRASAHAAAGLQCNGFGAWDAYGELNARPLFFHDHRITAADLDAARGLQRPPTGPLQVAFSGRLVDIKGPRHVIAVARLLAAEGAAVEFHILGDGPLRAELEHEAPPTVTFHGPLDFDTEWKEFVRTRVDLAFLPHPQGDPSCTYFEFLGLGVPLLAFANTTTTPLVRISGAGWTVPRGDVAAAAGRLRALAADRAGLAPYRAAGLDYLRPRSFERESERRVAHLVEVAQTWRVT